MKYKIVNIKSERSVKAKVLIVYTGGTFGMIKNNKGELIPFNFSKAVEKIPELNTLNLQLSVISFPKPIDSSNIQPTDWQSLSYIISENYTQYDGFVVLHGTDTMAFTASALSFMLLNLSKPIIFTGAQIPIGSTRSDARENLITSLEIASTQKNGKPIVNEVCIYFNFVLLRANRATKTSSHHFLAFQSENYPILATAGIAIQFNTAALKSSTNLPLQVWTQFNHQVILIKLFPGLKNSFLHHILTIENLKGIVIETYGSGNAPTHRDFIKLLEEIIKKGIIIVNISQCLGGFVQQGKYQSSSELERIGVISGHDLTTEAALTKLMLVLGQDADPDTVKKKMQKSLAGEISE